MSLIPSQTQEPQGTQQTQQTQQTQETQETQQTGEQKPAWLQEKFWDAASAKPNYEALATSYTELERGFHRKTEEIRADVLKDLRKDAPEKPDGYQLKLPDGLVPEGVMLELKDDDPMLAWWRNEAHKRGLSNDDFNAGVAEFVKNQIAALPNEAEEMKALGERAQARVDRVGKWLAANLSEKHFTALQDFVSTAAAVEAIEALMEKAGVEALPQGGGAGSTALTQADLDRMQQDPRYWDAHKRDPAFVKQVEEGYARLYPGKRKVA